MTDDIVISLADRRPKPAKSVGGVATVSNDKLYIPMSKAPWYEAQWVFSTTFTLDGEENCPLYGAFLAEPLEEEEPQGYAYEHEHGVNAQFVVGSQFWAVINAAALSPVPTEIVVAFYADEMSVVRDLKLQIQRKTLD